MIDVFGFSVHQYQKANHKYIFFLYSNHLPVDSYHPFLTRESHYILWIFN